MYIRNYPEDSVLRRHYEAAADRIRGDWLQQPPTDSVLRRHYDQMQAAPSYAAASNAPRTPPRPAPAPAAAPAPTTTPEPQRKGGLFGWLGRLFGG